MANRIVSLCVAYKMIRSALLMKIGKEEVASDQLKEF